MIRLLAVVSVLLSANCVSSFESCFFRPKPNNPCFIFEGNPRSLTSIWATGNDDNSDPHLSANSDSDGYTQEKRKMKQTSARIGGRRKRSRIRYLRRLIPRVAEADSSRNDRIVSFLSKFRTPALVFLLLFLVKAIFSSGETSTYYYSYESTVYETRSYISDGEVKTSRSESRSFKSNIPGVDQ